MANEIEVMIRSKADTTGFDKATQSTKDYTKDTEHYIEKADVAEQRTVGLNDTIAGTAAIMQGPGKIGIAAYIQGWADLASGFANLIIPAIAKMTKATITNGLAQVKTAAQTVAAWLAARATSLAAAAQMAAAWIISMGPLILVIAALAAVGLALIALWKKSETFRGIVKGAFDVVKKAIDPVVWVVQHLVGWFGNLVNFVGKIGGALKAIGGFFKNLVAPIGMAIDAVKRFLGVSGLLVPMGAEVVAIVRGASAGGSGGGSGVGSKSEPGFARGGIVGGGRTMVGEHGPEWLNLPPGTHVRSNADTRSMGYGGGGGPVVITFADDGSAAGRFILEMARKAVRSAGGGNVQLAFGS